MAEPKLLRMEEVPSENNKSKKRPRENSDQAANIEKMFREALTTVCTKRKNAHVVLQTKLKPVVEKAMRSCNYIPEDITTSTELTSQQLLDVWKRLQDEKWLWRWSEDITVDL